MSTPSLELAIQPFKLRMKTLFQFTCALLLLSAHISPAMAWKVTIVSKCESSYSVDVYTNHLFFNEKTCGNLEVPAKTTVICDTGGYCPLSVAKAGASSYIYFLGDLGATLNLPACWDVNVTIEQQTGYSYVHCYAKIK